MHLYTWLSEVESALYQIISPVFADRLASTCHRNASQSRSKPPHVLPGLLPAPPDLAERYLPSIAQRRPQDSIAREIMSFRGSAPQAAPVALAALTLRALIPTPDEDEHSGSSGYDLFGPFGCLRQLILSGISGAGADAQIARALFGKRTASHKATYRCLD
jgi:hypothetical protein